MSATTKRLPARPSLQASPAAAVPPALQAQIDPLLATALAFVGSGCLLVLEIVAGRIIAPTFGSSLYTWTSVIGVVLGGISLGNYLGGRLADRRPARSTLALIYVAGAAASLSILGLVGYVESLELPRGAPALLQVLWVTAALFLVPATILGAPTPLLTRLSLDSVDRTGRVVGRIQAAASLGSIVGVFATGFFLISWFGTRHIVAGVSGILLLLVALARPPWLAGRMMFLLALPAAGIAAAGWASHSPCLRESDYYCIRVESGGKYGAPASLRLLYLDRLLHSIVDLKNPAELHYGYELLYAKAVAAMHRPGSTVDALVLGGGGFTFPRYLEKTYRGKLLVAEIDPEVTAIARSELGLTDPGRMEIVNADARRVVESLPPGERFDLVFGDAFDDFEVPFHLTTKEFDDLVAQHLKPDGIYLANVIDSVHFDFLRSEIRTLRLTFPYVAVLAEAGAWPPQPALRQTFVVVAAFYKPTASLSVVPARELNAFVDNGHSVVLTDDHAPVDQLLAPVFSQFLHRGS